MADYCSTGLWNERGSNIEYSDVPISKELADEIAEWSKYYDMNSQDYLPKEERWRKFDVEWFNEQGEKLFFKLIDELDDWEVSWYKEEFQD